MKKRIIIMLTMLILVVSIGTPIFAANNRNEYDLTIPYPFAGSMQSTLLYEKLTGESPYVNQTPLTIPTNYFLSTKRVSSVAATSIVTLTSGKRTFTYQSGYGGVGVNYCLSAYPGTSGTYDKYNVRGTWSR